MGESTEIIDPESKGKGIYHRDSGVSRVAITKQLELARHHGTASVVTSPTASDTIFRNRCLSAIRLSVGGGRGSLMREALSVLPGAVSIECPALCSLPISLA